MSIRLGFARAIVRAASRFVPAGRRDEWRDEWEGELIASRDSRRGVVTFALGAIPHAIAELRQDWNVDVLGHELRHALRAQLRNPSYSLTAVLLIAVGVGANTTVFTLVNAVLLRAPSGVEAPNRLVQLGRTDVGAKDIRDFDNWSYPLYEDFRAKSQSFVDLAAYETRDVVLGDDADADVAIAQLVTPNFFKLLGAAPARGRGFVDDDNARGATPVAVISDALWRGRFGLDPNIVGKTIRLSGLPFRVVGIAAPKFVGPDVGSQRPGLWVPIRASEILASDDFSRLDSRHTSWIWILGRLKPRVEIEAARAEMRTLYRGIQQSLNGEVREDITLVSGLGLRPAERAMATTISAVMLAMVGGVLLVACANLAALLLARGAVREAEIGVRLAIGASRARVVRQLLVETTIVAVAGSVAAFVATNWTARFIEWAMPYQLSVSYQPDTRVLAFAVIVGVTTSVAFGVAPALRTASVDLLPLLRAGAVGVAADRGRARATLLVAQIALSFVLLGATGLLTRSVQRASSADPGFRTTDVLIGELNSRAPRDSASLGARRLQEAVARIANTPGVVSATLASSVPATGMLSSRSLWRADRELGGARPPIASTMVIDTGYFRTMGVPILRGRAFDASLERPGPVSAVVVSEALAKRLWPGEEALGREITFGTMTGPGRATVIGVSRDIRTRSLREPPGPLAYFLLSQQPAARSLLHVHVAPGQERAVATTLTAELRGFMPGSPPVRFQSAREWLAIGYADVRLISILGGVFGALALALAAAGIYGVVSYETARRRREYGIRLALGAATRHVHAMVFARSARLSAIGVAIGAAGFLAIAPLLEQWIFGISRFDPVTLVSITAVLFAAASLAALGPALRAARSDPIDSLRAE